jgi:hypothetical protein
MLVLPENVIEDVDAVVVLPVLVNEYQGFAATP